MVQPFATIRLPTSTGSRGIPRFRILPLTGILIATLCFLLGSARCGGITGTSLTIGTADSLFSTISYSHSPDATDKKEAAAPASPVWFTTLAGVGETTCLEITNKMRTKEWQDPNQQQVYLRQVVTEPPFFVSVHNSEYDVVRFNSIFQKGNYYEHLVRQRFEYILSQTKDVTKPFVLDVGGNIGYYTLLSAAWKHHVVTFEINPANLLRLCESLRYNEFLGQVKLHRQGVSDVSGQQLEIKVPINPGATSLVGGRSSAKNRDITTNTNTTQTTTATARAFSVSTITLDNFAQQHGWFEPPNTKLLIENFSIWKLDVEGVEGAILQGSKRLIASQLAQNVLIEYRPETREALSLLLNAGYRIVDDGTHPNKMVEDSQHFLDETDKAIEKRKNWNYADLWFRRADLPLV